MKPPKTNIEIGLSLWHASIDCMPVEALIVVFVAVVVVCVPLWSFPFSHQRDVCVSECRSCLVHHPLSPPFAISVGGRHTRSVMVSRLAFGRHVHSNMCLDGPLRGLPPPARLFFGCLSEGTIRLQPQP